MKRWWGVDGPRRAPIDSTFDETAFPPLLGDATVLTSVRDRRQGFTPEWQPRGDDAGVVLARGFSEQMAPLREAVEHLPDAQLRSLLDIGGVSARPPACATTMLVFELAPSAPEIAVVPQGAAMVAPVGDPPLVFETDRDLDVWPAAIEDVVVPTKSGFSRRDPASISVETPVAPFGPTPTPGNAIWLGLTANAITANHINLGVVMLAGTSVGAATANADPRNAVPNVVWDAMTATGPRRLQAISDTTDGLTRSGVVQLTAPDTWDATAAPGSIGGLPRRWLRARLVTATALAETALSGIFVNAVEALAAETIRDEFPEPTPVIGPAAQTSASRRYGLVHGPVLADSVQVYVDAPLAVDVFAEATATTGTAWERVDSLEPYGSADHVFVVDGDTVVFGDGRRGAAVPEGYRNVRVTYRRGGGSIGNVAAQTTFAPRVNVPFLQQVTNPVAAAGGADVEPLERVLVRGSSQVLAGTRGVTADGIAALAVASPATALRRAVMLRGGIDGPSEPGSVVVVVEGIGGAQLADAELQQLADFLNGFVAPFVASVVVRDARRVPIAVRAAVSIAHDADASDVLVKAHEAIDSVLVPDDTQACRRPIGERVRHHDLLTALLDIVEIDDVSELTIVVRGRPLGPQADAVLAPDEVPEAGAHRILRVAPEVRS